MELTLTWEQIALRLALACIASFVIGFNRDEHGHPAGIRTTMLVCLAATLAMLQVNLLLPLSGKPASSFNVMDLMRLPLGILSGIGFIGAGVIVKRDNRIVTGVTTAATMWFVTVLGLLFGGGQILTGITGFLLGAIILWVLKWFEKILPREHHATLHLTLEKPYPLESDLRSRLLASGYRVERWNAVHQPPDTVVFLQCELRWSTSADRVPQTPANINDLHDLPGLKTLTWEE